MGALVADIAAAFVLLVAGGCARVLWRLLLRVGEATARGINRLAGFSEQAKEFREVGISAAKNEDEAKKAIAQLQQEMYEEYVGTKNAGKVPLFVEDANGYLHVNEAWEKNNGKVPTRDVLNVGQAEQVWTRERLED